MAYFLFKDYLRQIPQQLVKQIKNWKNRFSLPKDSNSSRPTTCKIALCYEMASFRMSLSGDK
jgi:hypothetical protein